MGRTAKIGKTEVITLPRIPKPNLDGGRHHETGVVKIAGDSQIPREYITPGFTLDEAVVRTFLVDDNQVNDVTRLYDKLMKFHVSRGLDTLKFWLNAKRAVNGKANIYSLMGHTQIIAPEALGIRLSKRDSEEIRRRQEDRGKHKDNEEQHPA
jgi:hypothetical protein